MKILVPIDGSDVSFRALSFAAEMVDHYDGSIHVVHITDRQNEATEEIIDRAREVLESEGIEDEPEVEIDLDLDFRPSNRIGKDILTLVEESGYDHVVMGHHGKTSTVEKAILGSAVQTVLDAQKVPVTVVP